MPFGSFLRLLVSLPSCAPLVLAAAFACVATAESVSPDLVAQTRAETEAHAMRARDGKPLCFLPTEAVEGTEIHVLNAYSAEGSSGSGEVRYGALDVFVEETDAPVLLYLTNYEPVLWRLHLSEHARLKAVHLASYRMSFVSGLPEGTFFTWRYSKAPDDHARQDCAYVRPLDVPEISGMHRWFYEHPGAFGSYSSGGGPELASIVAPQKWLRLNLAAFTGLPVTSLQLSGPNFTISRDSVAEFEAIRRHGWDLLAKLKRPELPLVGPHAPVLSVPEDVRGPDLVGWLIEHGYAQPTTDEITRYLCERDVARAWTEGFQVPPTWCDVHARRATPWHLTLLGPVRIAKASCQGARVAFYVPPSIEANRDAICGQSPIWIGTRYGP